MGQIYPHMIDQNFSKLGGDFHAVRRKVMLAKFLLAYDRTLGEVFFNALFLTL